MTYRAHCEGQRRRRSRTPLHLYILRNGRPVATRKVHWWSRWLADDANRFVDVTDVGDVRVSTVFLGADHNFSWMYRRVRRGTPDALPILFETMVFGGAHHDSQERYASMAAAKRGHARYVALVRSGLN